MKTADFQPDTLRDWIHRENTLRRPHSPAVQDRERRERLTLLKARAKNRSDAKTAERGGICEGEGRA